MKKAFTIFRVKNGWIVQTYEGSTGYAHKDPADQERTYVFNNTAALTQFLTGASRET